MKEKKNQKQTWHKPELKILVKGLPEEDVLGCCKQNPAACQNETVAVGIVCS